MTQPSDPPGRVRFGPFELDPRTGELHSNGAHVILSEQPLRLLLALLDRPHQLVTRDELRQRLWPDDTFVDFEHGLNAAVRRLRNVLGDSADHPRYVETLPSAKCIRSQMPCCCQSRRRRQQVIPDPQPSSFGNICHGIPLRRTNRMPVRQARSETRGRRPLGRGGRTGISGSQRSHSASGSRTEAITG